MPTMLRKIIIPRLLILLVGALAIFFIQHTKPSLITADIPASADPANPIPTIDTFYRGHVIAITHEETKKDFGNALLAQKATARIDEGEEKGKLVEVAYEIPPDHGAAQKLRSGEKIVIGKNVSPIGTTYYVSDHYRLTAIWWILGIFFVLTVIFGGYRGLMAFIGLGFSLYIVTSFIIPHIVAGQNPLITSIIGIVLIALLSLYLAHGINTRTTIALIGTLVTMALAVTISLIFVHAAKLFGIGTEEAMYLQYAPTGRINLQGLLLGGIIIGVLGILDDITTSQAAAVEEIHKANPALGFAALYRGGTSVGREHITSLVNTLVLAYTGASFPLLLLFTIYSRPLWLTLNSELVVEEMIRAIVGSIALICAVPITTLLSAYVFSKKK